MPSKRPSFNYNPPPPQGGSGGGSGGGNSGGISGGKVSGGALSPSGGKSGSATGRASGRGVNGRAGDSVNIASTTAKAAPGVDGKPKDDPGGGNGGNGGGGNGGNGNGGDDDGDDTIIIYCHCCGCPWWDCRWCSYWSPMYWHYCGYDYWYWQDYWCDQWTSSLREFHRYYDFDNYYPSIYTPPAMILDPQSLAIQYIDEGAALFRQGLYVEAVRMFRLAVLADQDFAVPRFAYAHGLFAVGLYDYAAQEILVGLSLMPEWLDMGGDLRLMYGRSEDFTTQLNALIAHLKFWPGDDEALLVLGYVAYFSGDLYMTEKVFQKLRISSTLDMVYTAELFLEAVDRIKNELAGQGNAGANQGDDLTIDEILQRM